METWISSSSERISCQPQSNTPVPKDFTIACEIDSLRILGMIELQLASRTSAAFSTLRSHPLSRTSSVFRIRAAPAQTGAHLRAHLL
jgi:hypothetical protein